MKAHWRDGVGVLAAAALLLLMAMACGGGQSAPESETATQAPEASAQATALSPSPEPTSSPSPTAPLSWREEGDIAAAAQLCQEHLIANWNVDEDVRVKWALPTEDELATLAEGEPAETSAWQVRVKPMTSAAEALVNNYRAILFWFDDKYGRPASGDDPNAGDVPFLESMTEEPDWTPLFVQCIAAEVGAIAAATPEAASSAGTADDLKDGYLLFNALTFDINFTPYPEWLRPAEVCERIMGRVNSDQVLKDACIEMTSLTGLTVDEALPRLQALHSRLEEWLLQEPP